MPKPRVNLGAQTDKVYRLRDKYYALKQKADEAERAYKEELTKVYHNCIANNTSMARGALATFSFTPELVPSLDDALLFFKYVARTKNWGLLTRKVNSATYREMLNAHLEEGKLVYNHARKIDGVKPFERDKFSLRKR